MMNTLTAFASPHLLSQRKSPFLMPKPFHLNWLLPLTSIGTKPEFTKKAELPLQFGAVSSFLYARVARNTTSKNSTPTIYPLPTETPRLIWCCKHYWGNEISVPKEILPAKPTTKLTG